MKKTKPYWNFWKVVMAGWMIRYPKTFFNLIFLILGFGTVIIYKALNN
jgi:hypothetical protein